MSLKYVLFDLDGTLLPMDQDLFTKHYFSLLAKKLAPMGYDPKLLVDGIWAGTAAMVKNDGSCSNEEAFWRKFSALFGEHVRNDIPVFDEFYRTDFSGAKASCGYTHMAEEAVKRVRSLGLIPVLATNPIFPAIATENRIRWAGLSPEDFELYTTYENSSYCKPNPAYYQQILDRLGADAADCLMVGNDVTEDMVAASLGMKVFLLTDCLINKKNADISQYPNGSFEQLFAYIDTIL